MKKCITIKEQLTKVLAALLAVVIVLATINPINAEAKTKKINLAHLDFTTTLSEVEAAAKPLSKGTQYLVLKTKKTNKSSIGCGYAKFTAPADGTYKFTVGDTKTPKNASAFGFFNLDMVHSGDFLNSVYSGKTYHISNRYKAWKDYKKKRSESVTLKTGETVYLYLSYATKAKKVTTKVVIK